MIVLLSYCTSKNLNKNIPQNNLVEITFRNREKSLRPKFAMEIKRELLKDTIIFTYTDTTKTNKIKENERKNYYKLIIFKNNWSIILVDNEKCYFSGIKNYEVNGLKFLIKKYVYDVEYSKDEEGEYIINDSLGIVQARSLAWPTYSTYIKDLNSKELNEQLVKDTAFFRINYHLENNILNKKR
jgi:hypothetical protein